MEQVTEQFREVDKLRQTKKTDIPKVKHEIDLLLKIRVAYYPQVVIDCKESVPVLYEKYQNIFKYIQSVETKYQNNIFEKLKDQQETVKVLIRNYQKLKSMYSDDIEIDELTLTLFQCRKKSENELENIAKEEFFYSYNTFPELVKNCITVEMHRLAEFQTVFHDLLDRLEKVQKGQVAQADCTDEFLQEYLVSKYPVHTFKKC